MAFWSSFSRNKNKYNWCQIKFAPSLIKPWFHKLEGKPYVISKRASQEGKQYCEEALKLQRNTVKGTYYLYT